MTFLGQKLIQSSHPLHSSEDITIVPFTGLVVPCLSDMIIKNINRDLSAPAQIYSYFTC